MGDLQVLLQKPNGIISNEARSFRASSSYLFSSNPHPLSIGFDCWLRAEQTTQEIICQIRPTLASEQRRKEVTDYIQRLIGGYLGTKVFPYGSVPLKTYLPDGDIDLTAISSLNVEEALATHVHAALEREEHNKTAQIEVKDVQYINAEVKLIKCLVQNTVVDISFNQSGGLCTLCFLEHVDHIIGKNHLFKRSVILIKAWCYYESRILGAHHGLISTYALETLVLYIFHLFFTSLNGPLAVLYRFLDYFSKFDWDNYCVSLNGPICISSLPEIEAETLENDGGNLLLGKEFLRDCVDMFSVPLGEQEANSRAFLKKHLNIVDPLKENNNLGRSVSKGNFYRIRSAFAYGARKLGQILLQPRESIADELHRFFVNTLDRHGNRQRPDVQDPIPTFVIRESGPASSKLRFEKHTEDKAVAGSLSVVSSGSTRRLNIESQEPFGQICETRMLVTERKPDIRNANGPQKHTAEVGFSSELMETANCFANGIAIYGSHLPGDAKESTVKKSDARELPATSRIQVLKIGNETPRYTPQSSGLSTLPLGRSHHAPQLHFHHSLIDNGKNGNGNPDLNMPTSSIRLEKLVPNELLCPDSYFGLQQDGKESEFMTSNTVYSHRNHESLITGDSIDSFLSLSTAYGYGSGALHLGHNDLKVNPGNTESLNSLSDLSGDYESYLGYLNYVRWCHDAAFRESALLTNSSLSSQFRNKHLLDTLRQKVQFKLNATNQMNANGVIRISSPYSVKVPTISAASFAAEEAPRPRGVGTYFPSMNHHSYGDRCSPVRERNPIPVNHGSLQRPAHSNGWVTILKEAKLVQKSSQELLEAERNQIVVNDCLMQRSPHNNGWVATMQMEQLTEKSSHELLEAERNQISVNNGSMQTPPHNNGCTTTMQEEKHVEKSSQELLEAERKQLAVNHGPMQRSPHSNGSVTKMQEDILVEKSSQELLEAKRNLVAVNQVPKQKPPHNNGWATMMQEEKLIEKSCQELLKAERNRISVNNGPMQRPPHNSGWATTIEEEKPIEKSIKELLEEERKLSAVNHGPMQRPPRDNVWVTTMQEEKRIEKSSREELVEAESNQIAVNNGPMQRPPHTNCWATAMQEEKPIDKSIQELLEAEFPLLPRRAPPRPVESSFQTGHPPVRGVHNASGFSLPPEKHECGSVQGLPAVAPLPEIKGKQPEVPLAEVNKQPDAHDPSEGPSSSSPPALAMLSPNPVLVIDEEWVPVQSYHLKDDNDFPPLSCLSACGRASRRR